MRRLNGELIKVREASQRRISTHAVCPCSICKNHEIKVEDNFEKIGKENFVKLALSALEVSRSKQTQALTSRN